MGEEEVENWEGNEMETWQETCRKILSKERIGLDDMTELEHVDDHTIGENLRIRLLEEQIYVSICVEYSNIVTSAKTCKENLGLYVCFSVRAKRGRLSTLSVKTSNVLLPLL